MKTDSLIKNKTFYFPIMTTCLEEMQKYKVPQLSRVELVKYINFRVGNKRIDNVNFDVDVLVKEFYYNFATPTQKSLIESRFVNDYVSQVAIIDPLSVETLPMALDLANLRTQKEELVSLFNELDDKTNLKNIQDFNVKLEEFSNKISLIKEEEVFSLTGSSKVMAVYKNAEDVYENYTALINSYGSFKFEIERLFIDFSEIRDNLRYLREDFFVIVKCLYGKNLTPEELNLFDFNSVKWLEYATIQENLDLEFDQIQNRCNTFYNLVENKLNEVGAVFNSHVNKIGKNLSKKSYNEASFKTDLVAGGVSLAFSAVKGVMDSRAESKIVVENLRKDIEKLKMSFTKDRVSLQNDLLRLIELYNTVKNVFIPVTLRFNTLFFDIVENTLSKDVLEILKDSKLQELLKERTSALEEYRNLLLYVGDKSNICEELRFNIQKAQQEVNDYSPHYNLALSQKPDPISDVVLFLTLGLAKLYYKPFYTEWEVVFLPIEKKYNSLQATLKVEKSLYEFNSQDLVSKKARITVVERNINDIEKKIKELIDSKSEGSTIADKLDLLQKLANTSRKVLEISIHEELINPEEYKNAVDTISNKVTIVVEEAIDNIIDVPDNVIDVPNNIYGTLNKLINRVETMPSLDEVVTHYSIAIAEKDKSLDVNEVYNALSKVTEELKLDNYTYNNFRQKLVNTVTERTGLNDQHVEELINSGRRYLEIMEQVVNIRREIQKLQKLNESNDELIGRELLFLSQKVRSKIDSINSKKDNLIDTLDDEKLSSESKLDYFDNFLNN